MSSADSGRAAPSAIMPPQVTAAGFAVILGFMLLFPFLRISFGGAEQPRLLIHLFKTDFGFNIFAVLLLLTPLAGIIIAMMARSTWYITVAITAAIGVILVPLTIFTLQLQSRSTPNIMAHVAPAWGTFVFPTGLGIIAVVSALTALRARQARR